MLSEVLWDIPWGRAISLTQTIDLLLYFTQSLIGQAVFLRASKQALPNIKSGTVNFPKPTPLLAPLVHTGWSRKGHFLWILNIPFICLCIRRQWMSYTGFNMSHNLILLFLLQQFATVKLGVKLTYRSTWCYDWFCGFGIKKMFNWHNPLPLYAYAQHCL